MHKLLVLFLLLFSVARPALATPPTDTELLRQFMRAATDGHTSDSTLIARFMCPELLFRHNDARIDSARAMLSVLLASIRKQWQPHPRQLRQSRFLPSQEVPHPNFHMLGGEEGAYVLVHKRKPSMYFLVVENRVASFLLINQGGEAYFLDFCR